MLLYKETVNLTIAITSTMLLLFFFLFETNEYFYCLNHSDFNTVKVLPSIADLKISSSNFDLNTSIDAI